MRELRSKILEVLISTFPITVIVYIMALLPWFHITGGEVIDFSVSAVLLILGIGLFNMGSDLAMTPMGSHVGAGLSRQRKLALILMEQGKDALLPVAFDSGGVTTSPITVPFIVPLCVGISGVLGVRKAQGIVFSLPVSEVAGLVRLPEEEQQQSKKAYLFENAAYNLSPLFEGAQIQSVKNYFFDRLIEVKKTPKTSKPLSSAYRWYGRERFAQ